MPPPIWGAPPRWEEGERAGIDALLDDQRHLALQRACFEGDDLPDDLAPLLWLPDDPDALADDGDEDDGELDVGRDWAFGFFRGVELRAQAWERWLDAHDWIDGIFSPAAKCSIQIRRSPRRRFPIASGWTSSPRCRACSPTCSAIASRC